MKDWDPSKKLVFVCDSPVGPCRPFNLALVKKYLLPEVAAQALAFDVFQGLRNTSHDLENCMTEVIAPEDPRSKSGEMR